MNKTKSLKEFSLNLSEQDYHNLPAWSYSVIAKYAKDGFTAISTLHDRVEPTPAMEFGSLFDSIITRGKDTLKEYAVVSVSVPESERAVLDTLASSTTVPFDDLTDEQFQWATTETGYRSSWGLDARKKRLSAYKEYYDMKRSGKKLVSEEDWSDAVQMANAFKAEPYLKELFGTHDTETKEFLYQLQFKVDYTMPSGEEVELKIMPDLIVVDHEQKTIQPVDLKTSAMPAWQFKDNFIKYRYDIQASLYSDVLRMVMDKDEEYRNYTILPYIFSDISRSDKIPVSYVYDQNAESQLNGLSFSNGTKTFQYKGWVALLSEILFYERENAKVPSYISTDKPNNLLDILSQ